MRKSQRGYSRSAQQRRGRAAVLSQKMRRGDPKAAFSLLQRRRALKGIAKLGGHWRIELMNRARLAKLRAKQWEREAQAIRTATINQRRIREGEVAEERMRKQALKELEARLQRQRRR